MVTNYSHYSLLTGSTLLKVTFFTKQSTAYLKVNSNSYILPIEELSKKYSEWVDCNFLSKRYLGDLTISDFIEELSKKIG